MKNSISKNSVGDKSSFLFTIKDVFPLVRDWADKVFRDLATSPSSFVTLPKWLFEVPLVLKISCSREQYVHNLDTLLVLLTTLQGCDGDSSLPSTRLDCAGIDSICDKDILRCIVSNFRVLVRKACVDIAMSEYGL